jgi:hypothetical protein
VSTLQNFEYDVPIAIQYNSALFDPPYRAEIDVPHKGSLAATALFWSLRVCSCMVPSALSGVQ